MPASASHPISVRLELTRTDAEAERAAVDLGVQLGAEQAAPQVSSHGPGAARFIEPVSLLAVATVSWIAKRLVDQWLKDRERGVQIDLRERPPLISRLAGVPAGFLVIIDADGKPQVHQGTYERSEDLAPTLEQALGALKS